MDGGRIVFMKTYFRMKDEFLYFKKLIEHKNIVINETKNQIGFTIQIKHLPNQQLIAYFINVYIRFRFQSQIKKIIRKKYFYTNETDGERILEWTNWLLQERSFIKEQFNNRTLFEHLTKLFLDQSRNIPVTDGYIYFATFILCQFRSFHQDLIDIVGYAIDEMRREEEHQRYIHSVRHYITNRNPKCSVLHVLQGETLEFYSSLGRKYTPKQIHEAMLKEPLYMIGLDENETHLAPVISLLPRRLYIYGDNPFETKTLVILNVFQERAQLLSQKQFPF